MLSITTTTATHSPSARRLPFPRPRARSPTEGSERTTTTNTTTVSVRGVEFVTAGLPSRFRPAFAPLRGRRRRCCRRARATRPRHRACASCASTVLDPAAVLRAGRHPRVAPPRGARLSRRELPLLSPANERSPLRSPANEPPPRRKIARTPRVNAADLYETDAVRRGGGGRATRDRRTDTETETTARHIASHFDLRSEMC